MIESIEITESEKEFITAYFEAVAFAEEIELEELAEDFVRESLIDCLAFYARIWCFLNEANVEQAGHDFWLTRNGHGTGFWDRPETYGEHCADMFTKASEGFGVTYPRLA